MSGWGYRRASGAMLIAVAVCWDCGASTPTIPTSTYSPITRDAAIDALEYWKSVLNINYTIVDYTSVDNLVPPVVMPPNKVPTAHVGFAYVDEALNGLVFGRDCHLANVAMRPVADLLQHCVSTRVRSRTRVLCP